MDSGKKEERGRRKAQERGGKARRKLKSLYKYLLFFDCINNQIYILNTSLLSVKIV